MAYVKNNFYTIVKLNLNQFGATFMALLVSLGISTIDNTPLVLVSGIFTMLFYVYLQYSVMWYLGARDIIRVEGKRMEYRPFTGLMMGLMANIPNIILAILIVIGEIFGSANGAFGYEWAGNLCVVAKVIASVWEAMYNGFVQLYVQFVSSTNSFLYIIMIFPSLIATAVGYYFGLKNFRILGLFGIQLKPPKQ